MPPAANRKLVSRTYAADPAVHERLEQIVKAQHRSVSATIRMLVEDYVEQNTPAPERQQAAA